jgi:hypothetical protein
LLHTGKIAPLPEGKQATTKTDSKEEIKGQRTVRKVKQKMKKEIFKKLPDYAHVERLYKEEKIYDRLLRFVLNSPGLYALQEYEKVLKKEYPEQILDKYKDEVNKMAMHTSDRKHYVYLVSLLRKMQQMKGGIKIVEQDENFSFIAGYTPNGFPYGNPWKETDDEQNDEDDIFI